MATERSAPPKWPDLVELARYKGFANLTALARVVPCHKSTLSRINNQLSRPEGDLRVRLELLLGIPAALWAQLTVAPEVDLGTSEDIAKGIDSAAASSPREAA